MKASSERSLVRVSARKAEVVPSVDGLASVHSSRCTIVMSFEVIASACVGVDRQVHPGIVLYK